MSKLPARLSRILCLDDFEPAAHRHLPRPIFGYVSGSSETRRAEYGARDAYAKHFFRPRVLIDVSQRRQEVELLGRTYAAPFGIAPMGTAAMSAYRGDIALARAAQAAGLPMALSGSSLIRMEDVIAEAPDTWFQAYVPGDMTRAAPLIERVEKAGYKTLVLTVDVPILGGREHYIRSGFSTPLRPSPRLAWDGITRPRWLFGTFLRTLLRHGMPHFENSFATRGAPVLARHAARDFSARDHLNWAHLEAFRALWKGTLIVKGVLHPDDAIRAREFGADAVIVSNHGGRQLDRAIAPLDALPEIVAAVPGLPVMIDGGIRRGTDVLIALALGARFVFIGRPFNYAAAIGGEAGVAHAIDLLRTEIDRDMAMLGIASLAELTPDMLRSAQ
jgi:L-lactate dehydrogenase (cytochrome)